jgi:hypothetical protein
LALSFDCADLIFNMDYERVSHRHLDINPQFLANNLPCEPSISFPRNPSGGPTFPKGAEIPTVLRMGALMIKPVMQEPRQHG